MSHYFLLSCLVVLALVGAELSHFATNSTIGATDRKFTWSTGTPGRLQWLGNEGYCGEVSQIMAGLRYGQYVSQYDARTFGAVTKTNIQTSAKNWYLPGDTAPEHDKVAKLKSTEYPAEVVSPERYFAWAKKEMRKGNTVIMTVFMNYALFYGTKRPNLGEEDYDHIVSLTQLQSDYDDDEYHEEDLFTIDDHGLYAPRPRNPQYYFTYTAKGFAGNRAQANSDTGNVYTVPSDYTNFGTSISGVADTNGDTLPCTVVDSANYEDPPIVDGSNARPASMEITLTVTVSGLQDGVKYKLYKYDDENKVPTSSFNKHASDAVGVYDIIGTCSPYVMTEKVQSNQKVFFRAVRADAK